MKKPRLAISLGVIAALLAAIIWVPLPYRVVCSFEMQPADAANVFVRVPGVLKEMRVDEGQHVEQGDVIARLEDIDVRLNVVKLEGKLEDARSRKISLQRLANFDSERYIRELPTVNETILTFEELLDEARKDLADLTIKAPASGVVLPPKAIPAPPDTRGKLASWSGTPLEEKNLGAFLDRSVKICQIGDPKRLKANLIIDQVDFVFIHPGMEVELRLDEFPGTTYKSKIKSMALANVVSVSEATSAKRTGEVATKTDPSGRETPMSTSYEASVPFPEEMEGLKIGATGLAKIRAGRQTLGQRFWRYVTRTFNFRL